MVDGKINKESVIDRGVQELGGWPSTGPVAGCTPFSSSGVDCQRDCRSPSGSRHPPGPAAPALPGEPHGRRLDLVRRHVDNK
jgi:hypothetical protein